MKLKLDYMVPGELLMNYKLLIEYDKIVGVLFKIINIYIMAKLKI